MVLILKNIRSEGPGTIEEYLRAHAIPYRVMELGEGEVPDTLEPYDALVILGGPMGVYEMPAYPHLAAGSRLIREAVNRGQKVLGVCLGAQLIAHCLGARVYKGHGPEVGWFPIELTVDGVKDPLMKALAIHPKVGDFWRKFKVFHWHGDTFEIPDGARRLASSELYPNQAFGFGGNVYALQFHIEVTSEMLSGWLKDSPEGPAILKEAERLYDEYRGRAENFYKVFFSASLKGTRS